jgi:para-nitrobenzyl esterase
MRSVWESLTGIRTPGHIVAIASALAIAVVASASEPTDTLPTPSGPIRGIVTDQVQAYLGIPFAKPPVGELRWQAPKPVTPWKKTLETTAFQANCIQSPAKAWGPFSAEFLISGKLSEDCLYLNVWAAPTHRLLKPVYVFIHGGGFGSGSGSIPIYDGRDLAAKGVVVVTINYRVGIMGFLAHPQLSRESQLNTSGNYGLQDIIAALRWVHENIKAFGGDPSLVTIGGQSAGAAAVHDLLMSRPAKGLFARAIAESGSGMGINAPSLQEAEQFGSQFAATVGAADVRALRVMHADELQRLADVPPPSQGAATRPAIRFAPNIDGVIIASAPTAEAMPLSNVPLLTGYNTDEGQIFGAAPSTPDKFESEVRKRYGEFADRALTLYAHGSEGEATESMALISRDRYLASMLIFSETRVRNSGERIYDYVFNHPYPGPESARYKAFHTAEVPYVFGALQQPGRSFDAKDREVSGQLQGYWINFMRAGDPNGAGLPPWSAAGIDSSSAMRLGDNPGPAAAVSTVERLAFFKDYVMHGHSLGLF